MRSEGPSPEPQEGELARFFGYSHDLLAILDARGRVLVLSPSVESILGHAPGELRGQPLLDLVHPEERDRVRDRVRQMSQDQVVSDLDCRLLAADGRWVPMLWSISAHGPHGRIYGIGHDRTNRIRQAEDARVREITELRLRTAMELHDGILQTLTAAGLQLEVARRLIPVDPGAAEKVLMALSEGVASEQRELRLFVDEVKGVDPRRADRQIPLPERIADMLDRIRSIWGVGISLDADLGDPVDPELGRQVLRVIQEAVVNAARHGQAGRVAVRVSCDGGDFVVQVTDDGHGFPFHGEFDDEALREKRLGPVSLKRRVELGGGRISIRSTPRGSTIEIALPARREPDA
ncbi:MAG: PAS domain S-box protein [Longimicrobiales bacterium]|nr:PAS domain S-box protein [Longimicrobiales bacterium]